MEEKTREIADPDSYREAYAQTRRLNYKLRRVQEALVAYRNGRPSLIDRSWIIATLKRARVELEGRVKILLEKRKEWRRRNDQK